MIWISHLSGCVGRLKTSGMKLEQCISPQVPWVAIPELSLITNDAPQPVRFATFYKIPTKIFTVTGYTTKLERKWLIWFEMDIAPGRGSRWVEKKLQSLKMVNYIFFPLVWLYLVNKITLIPCFFLLVEVNAPVLASTFSQDSLQLIKLGEAVGAVLQSCTASKKPLKHVQITTQGKATVYTTGPTS